MLWILLGASPVAAGLVTWTDFAGIDPSAATNTVSYAGGSVTVTTDPPISVSPGALPSFATTSPRYADIDTARFDILVVNPTASQTGSPYRIELDFTDTALDGGGVVNVGGLFYHPTRGTFTEFTVEAFGTDDAAQFPLADLAFEQHAYVGSGGATGADAPLSWNPATGVLTVASGPTEQINSRFGFFAPSRGRIGRIVFAATTQAIASNGDQVYFGLGTVACAQEPVLEGARCRVAEVGEPDVCTDPLFTALERLLRKNAAKIGALLRRALAGPSASRIRRLATKADRKLGALERKLRARRFTDNVPAACLTTISQLVGEARTLLQAQLAAS